MTTFSLLRKIVTSLIDLQLLDLLGREVIVRSSYSAISDVREQLADALPKKLDTGENDPKGIGREIAKNGLLNLEYILSDASYAKSARTKKEDLRKILDEELPHGQTDNPLALLLTDIEETPVTLRIFLLTQRHWNLNIDYIRNGLPVDYWPLKFIVKDARIINSDLMWLYHHFYW